MRGVKFGARLVRRDAYRAVRQVRNLGEDPRPILEEWGGILEASTRARFDSGRGPGGVPWVPSRRVLRTAVGPSGPRRTSGKTLVDKGNLERSLRYEVRGPVLLVGVDGNSESAKNAAAHQFGFSGSVPVVRHTRVMSSAFGVPLRERIVANVKGHIRRMSLPARPFLGVDNNDRRAMTEAAVSYLQGLLRL